MNKWPLIIFILFTQSVLGQGLFETAGQTDTGSSGTVTMNGFTRGVLYIGENSSPLSSQVRSSYGELALKLAASNQGRASFYADFRARSAYEYNERVTGFSLREAYADLSLGNFDLRIGQQIIAWGRADGINPTHNISPRNYFVRSPDPDDMNMGNFAIRARVNPLEGIRLEAVWVPVYRYSVYRFDLFDIPEYVEFGQSNLPGATLENGSFAAKIELLMNSFDGSISWFNGFDPMPGIWMDELPAIPNDNFEMNMYSRAFRQQTLGLDFSCGMGSFGVRGEAALIIPSNEYKDEIYAPGQNLRYVIGLDRMIGNFSILAMYIGQFVFDFTELPVTGEIPDIDPVQIQNPAIWSMMGPMLDQQLRGFNSIIFNQTEEISHSIALRPSLSLFHELAEAEIFGLYNFSTEEWQIYPKLSWKVSDDLKLSIGGQYFEGPENSIYDMISPVFNGGFLEMRFTF
jgi:hypothetical protein